MLRKPCNPTQVLIFPAKLTLKTVYQTEHWSRINILLHNDTDHNDSDSNINEELVLHSMLLISIKHKRSNCQVKLKQSRYVEAKG